MHSPLLDTGSGESMPTLQTFLRAATKSSSFQRCALESIAIYCCYSGAISEQGRRDVGLIWTSSVRWCHHYVRLVQVIDPLPRFPGGRFRRLSIRNLRLIPPVGRCRRPNS